MRIILNVERPLDSAALFLLSLCCSLHLKLEETLSAAGPMAKTTSKRKVIAKRHAIPGNGQNKWDYEQRLVLRLLFADFSLDGKTASIIFNKLFAVSSSLLQLS